MTQNGVYLDIMGDVVTRKPQPLDRAAVKYIRQKQDDLGLTRPVLAERAGIPFQTLRGWWDKDDLGKPVLLSISDVRNLLNGLGIDPVQGFQEIERFELTLNDSGE